MLENQASALPCASAENAQKTPENSQNSRLDFLRAVEVEATLKNVADYFEFIADTVGLECLCTDESRICWEQIQDLKADTLAVIRKNHRSA